MKKKLLVILLSVFYSIHLNAQQQYKRCLDDGIVKWSLLAYQGSDSGIQSTEIAAYGDTLINGLIYKKLFFDEFNYLDAEERNTNWKNYSPGLTNQWKDFYIRESEDASKLFILDANEDEEYLISDLNLRKGDEFQIPSERHGWIFALVDSVYIKDDLKHIQLVFQHYPYDPEFLTCIEGVGADFWFIYPWFLWNNDGRVNCFQNQSIFYKKEFPDWWGNCPCGFRDMSGAIDNIDSQKDYNLSIKKDKIEIAFSIPGSRQISIYDVSGRLYYSKDLSFEDDAVIPSGSFPKGIYVLKIFGKDKNQINVSKIIL